MRKTILEIYAVAVCFFSVACLVITAGIALYDVVELAAPEFTLDAHEYERHQSDEAFRDMSSRHFMSGTTTIVNGEMIEKAEKQEPLQNVAEQRRLSYERALRTERRAAGQSLARMIISILITTIIFWLHWRLARRARHLEGG